MILFPRLIPRRLSVLPAYIIILSCLPLTYQQRRLCLQDRFYAFRRLIANYICAFGEREILIHKHHRREIAGTRAGNLRLFRIVSRYAENARNFTCKPTRGYE